MESISQLTLFSIKLAAAVVAFHFCRLSEKRHALVLSHRLMLIKLSDAPQIIFLLFPCKVGFDCADEVLAPARRTVPHERLM